MQDKQGKQWLDSQGRSMVNWVPCDLESQPGKRVGFRRSMKLKHMRAVAQMATMADVDFGANQSEALSAFSQIGTVLSQIILAWDFEDETGEPLPQPNDNPEVFEELSFEELNWLIAQMGQQVGSKNALTRAS